MAKTHVSRRERERKELRLKILDAGCTLFARGGESAVTLRRVGEIIEFSATAIYTHFPHKEALVQEICKTEFAIFGRLLEQAGRSTDALDRLKKVALAYIDFGLQHPDHYRVLFMREPARRTELRENVTRVAPEPNHTTAVDKDAARTSSEDVLGPYEHLQQAVFKAMAAGCFKPEYRDVELLAQTVWGCLHGVVALHLVRAQHPRVTWKPVPHIAEMSLEGLFNGLIVPSCQFPPTWRR